MLCSIADGKSYILQFPTGRRLYYVVRKRASFSNDYHDIGCEELHISVTVVIVRFMQKLCDAV